MPLNTILVGAGGYGANYVNFLTDGSLDNELCLTAIVDPYAQKSHAYEKFKHLPIYNTLDEFFAKDKADLTIISTPLFLHFEQCLTAMENGSHVLCEKPLVPTLDELNKLISVQESTGRGLSVGFQWCYSNVMLGLKERIIAGEFGAPTCLKTLVCWPRSWEYYARSGGWAGKIRTESGQPVYDSVISNATAHYIQNILFILGDAMDTSARLVDVTTKCQRANNIESFDTITLHGKTTSGADVYYGASHAVNYQIHPVMDYQFENARIVMNLFAQDFELSIHHKNGTVEKLGHGLENGDLNRLIHTAECIRGARPWLCSGTTVKPFTELIDSIFTKADFKQFPEASIVHENNATYVQNLHMDLVNWFHKAGSI